MWFSDRPRPQQRLALDLSSLFEIIPKQNWELFNESWWVVICKEWINIDHWRLDKFLMLIRFNLNAMFRRMAKENWDQEMVEQFIQSLQKIPLSGDKKIPNGIPFHIIDIFVDELEKVIFKDLNEKDGDDSDEEDENNSEELEKQKDEILEKVPLGELISVFDELSRNALYKALREKIKEDLLKDDRLKQWGAMEVYGKDKTEGDGEVSDEEDREVPTEDEEESSDDEWNGFD